MQIGFVFGTLRHLEHGVHSSLSSPLLSFHSLLPRGSTWLDGGERPFFGGHSVRWKTRLGFAETLGLWKHELLSSAPRHHPFPFYHLFRGPKRFCQNQPPHKYHRPLASLIMVISDLCWIRIKDDWASFEFLMKIKQVSLRTRSLKWSLLGNFPATTSIYTCRKTFQWPLEQGDWSARGPLRAPAGWLTLARTAEITRNVKRKESDD